MATAKAKVYAASLDECRRKDLFLSKFPTDAKGLVSVHGEPAVGQDWKELLRKFTKHCPGREVVAASASTEHALHLLLHKAAVSSSYYDDTSHAVSAVSTTSKPKLVWSPLILKSDRPEAEQHITNLESSIGRGQGGGLDLNSAKIVRCWALYHVGAVKDCLQALADVDKIGLRGDNGEGYDQVLRVIANAIEGFCHERIDNITPALQSYNAVGKLYQELASNSTFRGSFVMDQIVNEALFRLCFWSRSSLTSVSPYSPHRLYLSHSSRLPLSFRPTKAILVHNSFRKLLHSSETVKTSPNEWRAEVSTNNARQETILRATTTLPKAGSINAHYLEFLDDAVEGWRIGGSGKDGASEIVKILKNAFTHTFQSPRLLRHLIRVLTAQSDYLQAGKALKLYVELFDKSRETDAAQVAKDLRRFRPVGQMDGEKSVQAEESVDEGSDLDSDRDFISTALFGCRLLCKYLNDPQGGVGLAKRAREIFDEGKMEGLLQDKAVEAKIERALGISLGAFTAVDADLETRPSNHDNALQHLANSVALAPNSWESHYHLSYLLFELRQIAPAMDSAKKAVELNNKSLESWHLLGLLVAAQKHFEESLLVLETGVEECKAVGDDESDDGAEEATARNTKNNGNLSTQSYDHDSTIYDSTSLSVSTSAIQFPTIVQDTVPSASFDLPRDETDVLISQVQLRMTKNVVIEAMEGPEAALLDQQGLMSFFTAAFAQIGDLDVSKPKAQKLDVPNNRASVLTRRRSFRSMRNEPQAPVIDPPQSSARSRVGSFHSAYNANANQSYTSISSSAAPSSIPTPDSNPRATKLLVQLWLMSAASFRRAGRMEECRGAIAEAEKVNADDEEVWAQYAQYCVATGSIELARTCLIKGLSFALDHPTSIILLSRLYLATPASLPPASLATPTPTIPANLKLPYAESLLDTLTRSHGWDIAEAWFELSRCYKETGRREKEKECLVWALQLEETRSVRNLKEVLPRFI